MDLNNFKVNDTYAFMDIIGPNNLPLVTDEGKTMRLHLVGIDSPEYIKEEHRLNNQRLKKLSLTKRGSLKMTSEESEAMLINKLASCVVGWENLILDGESLEYSNDKAKWLLKEFPFIREQVDEFTEDRSNFFKN